MLPRFVMLSAAQHPHRTGFLALLGMTEKSVRNDHACHAERSEASTLSRFVMLSEAKHPHRTGFLATLGMTKEVVRNDTSEFIV